MPDPTAPLAPAEARPPGADSLQGTPYRATMPLGRGGMGEVLEALHVELDRKVVIKLLHQSLASEPKLVDRLRVEARTLAALAHPHIVSVSDFGRTPDGRPYFVMERLYGRTLRQELQARGPLPVAEAIEYVRQVLSALAAAHALDIVHRDVKADNVFLCRPEGGRPFVKLLDFGIAKILGGAGRRQGPMPQYPTQEGVLLGTPRTLAPEQAQCLPVDARTDIYAAGILLYTLIVGTGPFPNARGEMEIIDAHVREQPRPPSQVAQQPISAELDRAILKALAKRPQDRYQTAEQFADSLARIAAAHGGVSQPLMPAPQSGAASGPEAIRDDEPDTRVIPGPDTAAPSSRVRLFAVVAIASAGFFLALFVVVLRFFGGR